ncbi:unnamed protein product [Caenorhabditis bovis]|uniref:HAD family hydrolase n=1 Tax=Caenorhabditis bovis TaxID=2654633 RepID=A0A8S1E7Z9_9PELO|nr:unnamed protein product [Caenorhabditis bovis]
MSTTNSNSSSDLEVHDEQAIKGVIFDYGEVMWMQSRNVHVYRRIEEDNKLFENSLIPTLLGKELANMLPNGFYEDLLTGIYTAKDFDRLFLSAYNRRYGSAFESLKFFSATQYDEDAVYEEAVLTACLKLREHNIKTILLLDTYHIDEQRNGRRIPKMDMYFDYVIESCKEGYKKPDPRFYKVALNQCDLNPDEVIYIDDLKVNCEAARELGMRYIQVFNSMDMLEDLQEIIGFNLE